MKVFDSRPKNILYFIYRIINPIIDPIKFTQGIYGYFRFAKDLIKYKQLDSKSKIVNLSLFPILHEKTKLTGLDAHYFYQQLWAFEQILKRRPSRHVDIGSTYEMSGYISKITKAEFVDIRPIKTSLRNLFVRKGDILSLPYNDNSLQSVSCLHVVEHVGLGRYGDRIDPSGTIKACRELSRILKKGGYLYLSTPVGKNKICFNAHRIHSPQEILGYLRELKLLSFSIVDDNGNFIENVDYAKYDKLNYGCGFFIFTKR